MKKLFTLLTMLVIGISGMWAADYNGIKLTFSRAGNNSTASANVSDVSVNVTDMDGQAITGVNASLTGMNSTAGQITQLKTGSASALSRTTNSVLAPDNGYNNKQNATIEYTIRIQGLSTDFVYNKAALDVYALTGAGGYQYNNGNTKRYWTFDVATGPATNETTTFVNQANNDICTVAGPQDDGLYHKLWIMAATTDKQATDDLYIKVTLTRTDANGCFAGIREIQLFKPAATVQYVISDDTGVIFTSPTTNTEVGATITDLPDTYKRGYCEYEAFSQTMVEGVNTVNVIVTSYNLPFKVSSNFASATWYKAYFRGQSDEAAKYISRKTGTSYSTTTIEPVLTKASMWAFTGNPYEGFKVMNRAAGEGYYLGYDATGSNADVYMKPTGNSFLAKPITGGFSGFCLYVENTNSVLHDYHDKLSFWKDNNAFGDQGSAWTITEVVEDEIAYTVTDENGQSYEGTYWAEWNGNETALPSLPGAYGATFSNQEFSDEGGYSFTANIAFEFHVSSNSNNNPTAIMSRLGNSLWYAKDDKVIADNAANTVVYDLYADNYRWNIIPVFSEGTFTFKLYNVGADKYIPSNPSTDAKTATTLTADDASAGAFLYSHYNAGNGFFDENTSKFLTINDSGKGMKIYLWSAPSNTGHTGSGMSFPKLEIVSVSEAFAALKGATKFDILEGSTVMGPGEFDAPASINAAIDAAQDVEDNAEAKIAFIEGTNGTMIQNYLDQVAKYGALANIQITMNKEYGTMILPAACTRVTGLDIYSVNETVGNTLTLTPVEGNYIAKTPYIIHAEEGSKYTLVCWNTNSGTHTSGWLTGVLNSDTDIPSGSYMLATNKNTGVQAFYKVSGFGVKCAINKCYLTVPNETQARTLYLDIDGEITAIEEVFGDETEQGAIYNLAGQRLTKAQKGINIINGKKVIK